MLGEILLFGVLVPGLVAGIGLALVWRPWRRGDHAVAPPARSWLAPLVGLALFVGYASAFAVPPHPLGDRILAGTDWVLWVGLLAGFLFLAAPPGGTASWIVRAVLAAGVLGLAPRAMLVHHWEGTERVLWLAGLAGLLALTAGGALRANAPSRRATMPGVLLVVATGLALTTGLTGSAKLAQTVGTIAAALGAALILGLWHPRFRLTADDAFLVTTLLFGLGLCARFFSELPTPDALLVAGGLPAAAGARAATRSRPPVQGALATVAAAALPVGIAVTRAVLAFETGSSGYDY